MHQPGSKGAIVRCLTRQVSLIFVGLLVALLGVALILLDGSPHRYLAVLLGLPLLLIGLTVSGLGIILQGRRFGLILRIWGWISLLFGAGVLIAFGIFLAGALSS